VIIMADEKTRALTGPRQLKSMVSTYTGSYGPEGFPSYGNWTSIAISGSPVKTSVYSETCIDINLSLDRLTFFPESCFLQDPGIYYRTASVGADPANDLIVLDIVSTKKLNVSEVIENVSPGNLMPGMIGSLDDFNQIIMGTFRLMSQNLNFGSQATIQQVMSMGDFSSASAFAQDNLWLTRILIPRSSNFDDGYFLAAPSSRFIIQGLIGKEEELPYMMRLKNSYELLEKA